MSNNIEENLKQITELLSNEEVLKSLKNILGDFNGNNETDNRIKNDSETEKPTTSNCERSNMPKNSFSNDQTNFIRDVASAFSSFRKESDPGANLLTAIKPFLNSKRQKICSECVKALSMAKVFDYIQKNEQNSNL